MGKEKRPIKGVIFDLDETLAIIKTDWQQMRTRIRKLYAEYDIHLEFRPILQHIEEATAKIAQKLGEKKAKGLNLQALAIIEETALEGAKTAVPMDGAHEILQTSRNLGLRIGILSRNTRKSVLLTLEKCEFDSYIDTVIAREDCAKYKPDPLPVIEIAKRLGYKPEEVIMIGDHPYDVIAGKAAGAITIGVSTGFPSREDLAAVEPDYLQSNLAEVKALLLTLFSQC